MNWKEKFQEIKSQIEVHLTKEKIKEFSDKIFQDKTERILQDLVELETENPDDMRVKQKIGELHFMKGRTEDAIAKFFEIAKYYEKEDFILKAIKAYAQILKINPQLTDINTKLANLYLKLGMKTDASNQYRIAISQFAAHGNSDEAMALAQVLVKVDPSNENRAKLAEIYQSFGMSDEAIKLYETIAKDYRAHKKFDKLLHFYELILPHRPDNKSLLKDVCILNLRNQNPKRALKLLEQYNALDDKELADLVQKAQLMIEAMKK